ncbi:MAG: RING finger protein [Promethearchaeota archaeon]
MCPNCHTIYHWTHLSIWLKIRKKCPICKNIIRNGYNSFYYDLKERYSASNNEISQTSVIPRRRNQRVPTRKHSLRGDSIVLECPHCQNILEPSNLGEVSQCQMCGSQISWINDLESRIKHLNNLPLFRPKKHKRGNGGRNDSKLSYRNIEQQKEKKRELLRKELQEQTQLKSQEQMLVLNQDYFRRKIPHPRYEQSLPLRIINLEEIKKNPKKINYLGLGSFILVLTVITVFIFVAILG